MQSVEFRHIRYFLAVFEHGSFTRAADALCVTQPTVSKGLRELEEQLRTSLFFRHSSHITPTASGMKFHDYAHPLLALHEEGLFEFCSEHSRTPDTLRIGITFAVDERLFVRAQRIYRDMFPNIVLEPKIALTSHVFEDLKLGRIDAAIATLPFQDPSTAVTTITRERMVVCMRADDELATFEHLSAAQIADRLNVFRSPSIHPHAHARLLEMLAEKGIESSAPAYSVTPEETLELVRVSCGLTLVREHRPMPDGFVTRPLENLNWTVDSAVLFRPSLRHRMLSRWAKRLQRAMLRKPLQSPRSCPDTS